MGPMRFTRSPLDELLASRFDGLSDRDLERRHIISRRTLRKIREGGRPSPLIIASLARSLSVPERLVVEVIEATLEKEAR